MTKAKTVAKDDSKKPGVLSIDRSKTLSLGKSIDPGSRAPAAPSRGKTVMVEVRKTRNTTNAPQTTSVNTIEPAQKKGKSPGLTDSEREARLKALQNASASKIYDAAEVAAKIKEEQNVPIKQPKHESLQPTPPDASNEQLRQIKKTSDRVSAPSALAQEKEREREKTNKKQAQQKEQGRFRGKLTVVQALATEERTRSMASIRRAREKAKRSHGYVQKSDAEKIIRDVIIPEVIDVQELANRMAERTVDVIKALMKMGVMATANQSIDADTAELVVNEFGHKFKRVTEGDVELIDMQQEEDTEESLKPRPPVVTIMGHVDHGKTSLLDAIRKEDVVSGEAGGITQHIGAYQITTPAGEKISFIDTPGHAAFTAMRARGAKVTDIVVLVVAADDGIMPQTIEAISHAKAAEVPIIVAINKIDKPEADPSRVKNELLSYELIPEDMGGDIMVMEVSAKTKDGLDKLLETILLQAEMMDLKANPDRASAGIVIEAKVDKGRGVVATVLVQKGTLDVGDLVISGSGLGKVRALVDDKGKNITIAGPSMPVEILGLSQLPSAGDDFVEVENEKRGREIVEYREKRARDLRAAASGGASLDSLFLDASGDGAKELAIIIKGDVQGSVEAIQSSIAKLENDEVKVKVVHMAAGGVTESDVTLAMATKALILAFNVRANGGAKEAAVKENVDIRYYAIIYNLIDDIKAVMSGLMKPIIREQFLGNAEIREIFSMSKYGKVAGCYIKEGIVKRGAGVRLIRDNVVIHTGKLKTLKRFKDDVAEVKESFECGMAFENYEDIKAGDVIEAYETIEESQSL